MIHLVPPEDRKVTQRMSKALARDNRHVADVEGTSIPMRCWKCEGTLRPERDIDHAVWRLDPPVRVFQLWLSLACGGQAATRDGCLSHAMDSSGFSQR